MNDRNKLRPLTKEQSAFAAERYSMVFDFLGARGLDADDYHDVVILSFLSAVQQYLEHPELQMSAFHKVAYRYMGASVCKHQKKQQCQVQANMPALAAS